MLRILRTNRILYILSTYVTLEEPGDAPNIYNITADFLFEAMAIQQLGASDAFQIDIIFVPIQSIFH